MQDGREPAEEEQHDVDDEVGAAAGAPDDGQGREEDGDDAECEAALGWSVRVSGVWGEEGLRVFLSVPS